MKLNNFKHEMPGKEDKHPETFNIPPRRRTKTVINHGSALTGRVTPAFPSNRTQRLGGRGGNVS